MKYRDFEVDPSFVKGGSVAWTLTGNGSFIIGTRKGKKYFVKRNFHLNYPSKSTPAAIYDIMLAPCLTVERKQEELRRRMKALSWERDGIVAEEENFWDEDNKFVTVTVLVPGVIDSESDFTGLSRDNFLKLCLNLIERLEKLHASGVIHGDLKMKNILFKPKDSSYETYLIDFDSSYPTDSIPEPDNIGGTVKHLSPEIIAYQNGGADASVMTTATDIFTLGLLFHHIWSGAFPDTDASAKPVGDAVLADEPITIAKKFNEKIGKAYGATFMSLINWMLAKEPSARPRAKEVREVLEDKAAVPAEYHKGDDDKPFDSEPWAAHKLVLEILPMESLQAMGVLSFKRVNEGKGSEGLKYSVTTEAGARVLSAGEIIAEGYAKRLLSDVDEAWADHEIEMESAECVSEKGYAKIKRATIFFRKRYLITTAGGRQFDKGADWLVSEGLAHYKRYERVEGSPWEEHGTEYVPENMAKLGITAITRVEIGGEHRYKLTYKEIVDGKPKVNDNVSVKNVKLMGLIR